MNNLKQHDQLWNGIIKTLNNLSYISAGAISLSITFLGYILSINPPVRYILYMPIYKIPTIYVLFLSWFFLFIAMFLGIIIQFFIERYIFESQTVLLLEDSKNNMNEKIKENTNIIIKPAQVRAKQERIASRRIQKITVISFALGIFLLMVFVIVIVNGLVKIQT